MPTTNLQFLLHRIAIWICGVYDGMVGVTAKEKSLHCMMAWDTHIGILLSGTKFWSIAGLQSTCYGRGIELELKQSLLIEQQMAVLVGNGNFN
jgi:hypothetical protein